VRQATSRLWRVFPVLAHGRSAYAQALIKDATCDEARLEQLAYEHHGCNWGVATGRASRVFAVHADDERGPAAFVAFTMKYEDEHTWQETLELELGDRAVCSFFLWPEGLVLRAGGRIIAPGLSIRGDGDWIVVPPSTNSAGAPYKYRDAETSVAPPPNWLVKRSFVEPEGQPTGRTSFFSNSSSQPGPSIVPSAESASGIILPFSSHARDARQAKSRHRVQMLFRRSMSGCWTCRFIDEDLRSALPCILTFLSSEKVVVISERGGGLGTRMRREILNRAIARGHGGVILELTGDQYSRLKANG
jgi:hypothetical protein